MWKEVPYTLHLVSASGDVLPNCGIVGDQKIDIGEVWISLVHLDFAGFTWVCVCVFSAVLSRL